MSAFASKLARQSKPLRNRWSHTAKTLPVNYSTDGWIVREGLLITFEMKMISSGWGSDSLRVTDPPVSLAAPWARPQRVDECRRRVRGIRSGAFSNSFISLRSHKNKKQTEGNARHLWCRRAKPSGLLKVRFRNAVALPDTRIIFDTHHADEGISKSNLAASCKQLNTWQCMMMLCYTGYRQADYWLNI